MHDVTELANSILTSSLSTLMLGMVLTMLLKDAAVKVAGGLMFKLNPNFNAGDRVFLEKEEAIIISIGLLQTQFEIIGVLKDDPKCTKRLWKYVQNDRLNIANLSKVK